MIVTSYCMMCDTVAIQWINAHTVVAMDTTERVHLLNVRDDTPIEVTLQHFVSCLYFSPLPRY